MKNHSIVMRYNKDITKVTKQLNMKRVRDQELSGHVKKKFVEQTEYTKSRCKRSKDQAQV